jgi:hypothetical protein
MLCKGCQSNLPESCFYASNRTKCKECIKKAATKNRLEKIEYYRSYDRMRGSQPHRVAARSEYRETDAYRYSHAKANEKYKSLRPKMATARNAVSNALRDMKITRQPCFMCGQDAEAHHADYDRPLDVVWLCDSHHKETHKLHRQIERERKSA